MSNQKNILIAPLNWGLGHATRCVPIINALEADGYTPIIASDGVVLLFLQQQFPHLQTETLPSYQITYPKNGKFYNFHFLKLLPNIIKAVKAENKKTQELIKKHEILGLISDNRLGVYSAQIPSVYITHQLTVFSGIFTFLSSKLHQYFIKKHNVCWVPDVEVGVNLSGELSHLKIPLPNVVFIGPLTRMTKHNVQKNIDVLVVLSGPEPQRTLLEVKILSEFKNYKGSLVLVQGLVANKQTVTQKYNQVIYNFMTSQELENTINSSKLVICRAGYTSIMDLAFLQTNAILIPTPGQKEQEYLAKKLKNDGLVYSCTQTEFTLSKLNEVTNYKGFNSLDYRVHSNDWADLFKNAGF